MAAAAAASGSGAHYSVRSSDFPSALRANMDPYGQPTRGPAEQNTLPSLTLLRAGLHRCCNAQRVSVSTLQQCVSAF